MPDTLDRLSAADPAREARHDPDSPAARRVLQRALAPLPERPRRHGHHHRHRTRAAIALAVTAMAAIAALAIGLPGGDKAPVNIDTALAETALRTADIRSGVIRSEHRNSGGGTAANVIRFQEQRSLSTYAVKGREHRDLLFDGRFYVTREGERGWYELNAEGLDARAPVERMLDNRPLVNLLLTAPDLERRDVDGGGTRYTGTLPARKLQDINGFALMWVFDDTPARVTVEVDGDGLLRMAEAETQTDDPRKRARNRIAFEELGRPQDIPAPTNVVPGKPPWGLP